MRISVDDLEGRPVIGADGQAIGELTTFFVDTSSWQVESLQMKLRKGIDSRLGVTKSLFRGSTFDVPVHLVQSVGDGVVLSVTVEGLRRAHLGERAEEAAAPH